MDKYVLSASYLVAALMSLIWSFETLAGEEVVTSALASMTVVETLVALSVFVASSATLYGAGKWITGDIL
ncbi:hypothetical protein [Halorubrum distributum]|uniref:hypothetical protein n=1 Tax=Halorubrum distributum TaxID=29283 RepID=UPI001269514E|nr:hypothetical protein [Halorubrum arcis]